MPYDSGSFRLEYAVNGERFVNLIGQLPGRDASLPPVIVGAHYDTCGDVPGADDNAAAVAATLAAAERRQGQSQDRSIVFAFFDAEEPPHFHQESMGSIRFYHDQRTGPIHAAVVMDLVGHDVPVPGIEDLLFITGIESDPDLQQLLIDTEPKRRLRIAATVNSYVGDLSDHHVFRLNRVPYLFLTCGRWDHYHQTTDTPDRHNYIKLAAVAVPALVPSFGYEDLKIGDGSTASAALETLLLDTDALADAERKPLTEQLLRYCQRDTLAMTRFYERLQVLSGASRPDP